jgi:hypothetical protein
MRSRTYPSDLTDEQWALVEHAADDIRVVRYPAGAKGLPKRWVGNGRSLGWSAAGG